jgi:hypothetical protein
MPAIKGNLWTHVNCTSKKLVEHNGTNMFMDPISFVIRPAAVPVCCNDIVPTQGGSCMGAGTLYYLCITPTPKSVMGRDGGIF